MEVLEEDIIPFYDKLNDLVIEYCDKTLNEEVTEGGKRGISGALGEIIAEMILEFCCNHLKIENFKVYRGSSKKIKCYKDENSYVDIQVDRHLDINDELKICTEAKTYLDSSMLVRAINNFQTIKEYKEESSIKCYIIALQNATKDETFNFYVHNDCDDVDNVFFLMDGSRKSSEPLYEPQYRKTINLERLKIAIETIIKDLSNE
jgi:hypothetical protein